MNGSNWNSLFVVADSRNGGFELFGDVGVV